MIYLVCKTSSCMSCKLSLSFAMLKEDSWYIFCPSNSHKLQQLLLIFVGPFFFSSEVFHFLHDYTYSHILNYNLNKWLTCLYIVMKSRSDSDNLSHDTWKGFKLWLILLVHPKGLYIWYKSGLLYLQSAMRHGYTLGPYSRQWLLAYCCFFSATVGYL